MASRMNSGGSNYLNCNKIDPQTGEKFSFNMDTVAATAWQHPQQCTFIHARELFHVSSNGGIFVIVLYNTSLLTNEIGCYAWDSRVGRQQIYGSLYGFLSDVIHSRSIACLRGFAKTGSFTSIYLWRKGLRPF